MKTEKEINAMIDKTFDNEDAYPGMSYTDGIKAALSWVMGYEEEEPYENENKEK